MRIDKHLFGNVPAKLFKLNNKRAVVRAFIDGNVSFNHGFNMTSMEDYL